MRPNVIAPAALLLICISLASGQTPRRGLAIPGPAGVYVNLGLGLPSVARPSNGVVSYRVERRQGGEKTWRQIAEVQAPASPEELQARISESMRLVPPPLRVDSLPVNWIWQRMPMGADSLRIYGTLLPVRLALGIVYLDTGAPLARPLEYRISHINRQGGILASFTSGTVFLPASVHLGAPRVKTWTHTGKSVRMQWTSSVNSPTKAVQMFRRDNLKGAFVALPPSGTVAKQRDSLQLDFTDPQVQPDHIYEYYLIPLDAYGNAGVPSDTVRLATYDIALASTALSADVQSEDSVGGLRIRWELQNPGLVREITLCRSERWDSGFTAIAHLSPTTNEFIDQDVAPMNDYYYYVETVGLLGERMRSSATIHGLFQSSLLPLPPAHLQTESSESGVRLAWTSTEENIQGYYVYRGNAAATTFDQVSPFIPAKGSEGTFTDSSAVLSPRFTYSYVVRSENTSHHLSPFSDTVFVRPGMKTLPKPPLGLRANLEGEVVHLVWEDAYSGDPTLLGFKVLRRTPDGASRAAGEFRELTDSLLPARQNHYEDPTGRKGQMYEYTVRSFDIFGGESAESNIARLEIPAGPVEPPAGLRASPERNGILVEWDGSEPSKVAGYRLYRHLRGEQPVRLANLKARDNTFTDTTAVRGQLYFYFATTIGGNGTESGRSAEVSARR